MKQVETEIMSGSAKRLVFENVARTEYKKLNNPTLVEGIVRCVNNSGMVTSRQDVLDHIYGDVLSIYMSSLWRGYGV